MIEYLRKRIFGERSHKRSMRVDAKLIEVFRSLSGMGAPSHEEVLGITAAYAAIYAISSDTAVLPFKCYQRTGKVIREATEKLAGNLLNVSPDGVRTGVRFRQHFMGWAIARGNAYAEIRFRGDGQPGALHLLPPETMPCYHAGNKTLYYDLGNGTTLPPRRVLHLAGLGGDGLLGYSPIALFKRAFSLNINTEKYGDNYFINGSRPGGVIEYPGEVSPGMRSNLEATFEERHGGTDNAHRVHVLEEGATYKPITIPNNEAQFIETRKFGVSDIARIYRVPPHKIADYSQMQLASAGVEAANIDYIQTTLMVWARQLEAECNLKFLTDEEREQGYYFKHNFNALLRGDMKTRSQFYREMFGIGVYSQNEIRELEELDPIEGGDKHYYPLNMGTVGKEVADEQDSQTVQPLPSEGGA